LGGDPPTRAAVGAIAVLLATVVAVVMLVRWVRCRRGGRPVTSVTWMVFLGAVTVAALSTAWLVHERADKCDQTVARTLCEPPTEWLRF
jgi:hypothetical protein